MEELVRSCRGCGSQLIIGCDANAHHVVWGSSNTNVRVLLICLSAFSLAEDDNKWVWRSGNRRSEEPDGIRGSHAVGKPRYEVTEEGPFRPSGFRPPPDFVRPGRPTGVHQEPGFPDGPFPNRPGLGPSFIPNDRPGGIQFFEDLRPGGNRPGGNRPGGDPEILTGPVPSWVKEPPFKNYDTCKCAEKFNCNSPGIAYGQCDVGKQYCCFHSKKDGNLGGPLPSRPIHSPENGVLVGPGGPVDYPGRPQRPYPRPPHFGGGIDGDHNGVLVGPGGPTGIIGRPPNRPFGEGPNIHSNIHSQDLGILVGPGGPHGGHFRPPGFGYNPRNAKSDKI